MMMTIISLHDDINHESGLQIMIMVFLVMLMTITSPHDDVNHESGLQIMIIIIINIKTINCFDVDDDDDYLLT